MPENALKIVDLQFRKNENDTNLTLCKRTAPEEIRYSINNKKVKRHIRVKSCRVCMMAFLCYRKLGMRKALIILYFHVKGRKVDWKLVRDYLKRFVGIAMRWNRVRRRSISVENCRMNTPVQRVESP